MQLSILFPKQQLRRKSSIKTDKIRDGVQRIKAELATASLMRSFAACSKGCFWLYSQLRAHIVHAVGQQALLAQHSTACFTPCQLELQGSLLSRLARCLQPQVLAFSSRITRKVI